ncbi:hypothetical protein APHAL10511_001453 [Amanita phalloides]|nr:hypothetical protein APHAL10511_001453 [Amanita phalloides]
MDQIITHLTEIAGLVPTQSIAIDVIHGVYPEDLSPQQSKGVDLLLTIVVNWYLSSVRSFNDRVSKMDEVVAEKDRMIAKMGEVVVEKDRMIAKMGEVVVEKDRMIAKMDEVVAEKDKRIAEKDEVVVEKDRMIAKMDEVVAEKDKRIAEKDEAIQRLEESADIATALRETRRTETGRKWGSVTRSQAWKQLKETGRVSLNITLNVQQHPHKNLKILKSKLSALEEKTWTKELDMYPDLIGAIKDGLYKQTKDILVVDTSQRNDFHADVSIATYDDARLPYSVRYFLEFKLPSVELQTATHCGQMLDYFKSIREKQPHRSHFIGVLSNYSSSWVYNAVFDEKGPKIEERFCPSLADAIIYAETSIASQLQTTIPSLDKALDPKFSVLALGKHYFLLSVKRGMPLQDETVPKRISTRHQAVESTHSWFPPLRHRIQNNQFVLKITHDNHLLDNEIKTLTKLSNAKCPHIPDLVWVRGSGELGILPIGEPVLPGESVAVSRKVVRGMIDGLRYLHDQGIIHRDVRLSNLILKRHRNDVNVVIIDYETAFDSKENHSTVNYLGVIFAGQDDFFSQGSAIFAQTADELFACILVVLHLLVSMPIWMSSIQGTFVPVIIKTRDVEGITNVAGYREF